MDPKLHKQLFGSDTNNDNRRWCVWQLQKLMPGCDLATVESLTEYILTAEVDRAEKRIFEMVGDTRGVRVFAEEFRTRRSRSSTPISISTPSNPAVLEEGMTAYKKPQFDDDAPLKKRSNSKKKRKEDKSKRLTSTVLLPGRRACECQATIHALVGNCLRCGKIVCEQEGEGPCLFCQSINLDDHTLHNSENDSTLLLSSLPTLASASNQALDDATEKARAHLEKLLEFGRTAAQRTHVYDDQADYFSSENRWIAPEERARLKALEEEARKKREEDRRKVTITLDLAGRQVLQDKRETFDMQSQAAKAIDEMEQARLLESNLQAQNVDSIKAARSHGSHVYVNPFLSTDAPSYVPTQLQSKSQSKSHTAHSSSRSARESRIQHEYFTDS